jgi:hypothetical protein
LNGLFLPARGYNHSAADEARDGLQCSEFEWTCETNEIDKEIIMNEPLWGLPYLPYFLL